jgi:hypothetical protein
MKSKIFYSSDEKGATMEKEMNEWFRENQNISIYKMKTCTNKYCFWVILIYSEIPKPLV